jgi:dTDP-glucose 4,6-dehydratase/UDP-glucose 4-epimerase
MKILVLGSEGFIGKACVNYFQAFDYQIFGCDLIDLKDPPYTYFKLSRFQPEFNELFVQEQYDCCINAAGSGSVPLSIAHPFQDFEANTIDTVRILENIRLHNPNCKYINLSSAAVYGNPQTLPIKETNVIKPLSPYGWHKYYSELICTEYYQLHQISTVSLRLFSIFGEGLKKQLFWDIYQKTKKGSNIELFGTGQESRDFLYIRDVPVAIHLIIKHSPMQGNIVNVSSGIETSILEATTHFCRELNPALQIVFNGQTREGDPKNWRADVTLLKSYGFEPSYNIFEGLTNVVKWLKEKE